MGIPIKHTGPPRRSPTISLSKAQTKIVTAAVVHVPHEKRAQFFQRITAMLTLRGCGHFDDNDVADAVTRALSGLVHAEA